jgi:predicted nicotinamide N-methyase
MIDSSCTAVKDKQEAEAAALSPPPPPPEEEEETHWTDDRIRWEGGLMDGDDKDDDEPDAHECPFELDIFADHHPQRTFTFPFRLLSTTTSSSSPWMDIHLEGYKQHSDQIWKSTGLTLWRAAETLCDYLIEHAPRLGIAEKRVLELGSGLGLVGLVAHKIQAAAAATAAAEATTLGPNSSSKNENHNTVQPAVCLTDGDTLVLKKLRENMKRNRHCNNDEESSSRPLLSCHQLLWGRDTSQRFLETTAATTRTRESTVTKKFDIILGSDLIYSPLVVNPMFETVQTLLNRDADGVFLMAFAKRNVPVSKEDVLEACDRHGFVSKCVVEDLTANGDSDNDPAQGVFVYEIRWK